MRDDSNIRKIQVTRLLAFKELSLEFSPGITVLIGTNSTGKTHLMKLAYAMLKSLEEYRRDAKEPEGKKKPHIQNKLIAVFRPDDRQVGRLVHRSVGQASGSAELTFSGNGLFRVGVTRKGRVTRRFRGTAPRAIFIPSREVLSIYPGFIASYENRELAFDETYYDLCKALSAAQLRGPRGESASRLINPLLEVLGGRVVLDNSRFVLKAKSGNFEAPLLSEGYRKLGALVHLIANGSLTSRSVLFWDEPEANLNPRVVTVMAMMLRTLAAQGTQVILATHDFLLSQELSIAAEYQTRPSVPMKFVALSRNEQRGAVSAQSADSLVGLGDNPILAEFAAHYDREQSLIEKGVPARDPE